MVVGVRGITIERDAPIDHPALADFMAQLGGVAIHSVARRPVPEAKPERCYWNVQQLVSVQGGGIRFGWMITERVGQAFMAWHHAVWRQPVANFSTLARTRSQAYAQASPLLSKISGNHTT